MAEQITDAMKAARARNEAMFSAGVGSVSFGNSLISPTQELAAKTSTSTPIQTPTPDFAANIGANPTMDNVPKSAGGQQTIAGTSIPESNSGYMTMGGQSTQKGTQSAPIGQDNLQTNFQYPSSSYEQQFPQEMQGRQYVGHDDQGNPIYSSGTKDGVWQNATKYSGQQLQNAGIAPLVGPQAPVMPNGAMSFQSFQNILNGVQTNRNNLPILSQNGNQARLLPGWNTNTLLQNQQLYGDVKRMEELQQVVAQARASGDANSLNSAVASINEIQKRLNGVDVNQVLQNIDPTTGMWIGPTTQEEVQARQAQTQAEMLDPTLGALYNAHDQFGVDNIASFLGGGMNPYQKIMADYQGILGAQIGSMTESYDAMIKNLQNRAQIYQDEAEITKNRWAQQSDQLKDVALQQRDNALRMNELQAAETDAQFGDRLAIMEDNNSRYMGYLKGKFEAMGMLDSAAGLELIGKYMGSAQMAINETARGRVSASMMYAQKSRDIMTEYFDNVYKINTTQMENEQTLTFNTMKAINEIEGDTLKTQATKDQNILGALKELNDTQLQVQQQADYQRNQERQYSMDQAKFQYGMVQDALKNDQWERQFGFSVDQAERQFGFDVEKFEESKKQFGMQYAMQEQQHAFDQMNANRSFQSARDQYLTEATGQVYLNGQATGFSSLDMQKFMEQNRQFNVQEERISGQNTFEMTKGLVDAGVLSPEALKVFTPNAVIASTYSYVPNETKPGAIGAKAVYNLGERIAQVSKQVSSTYLGSNCVEFVRKIIPSLPTGLWTLADKMKIIGEKFTKVTMPQPGDVLVQYTGQTPGHVAVVSGVDPTTGKFTVSESNWKSGQYGTRTMNISDSSVRGFFRAPEVKNTAAADIQAFAKMVQKDPDKITAVPEKLRGQVLQTSQSLPSQTGTGTPTFKNDQQANSWSFANRMVQASEILNQFDREGATGIGSWWEMTKKGTPFLPTGLKGEFLQKQEQAERQFVNAVLRKESGATITDQEFDNARQQYFPQPGEGADIVAQKQRARQQAIQDMYVTSGQPVPMMYVRTKDGQTGKIPAYEFDPGLYTKIQ